MVGIPITSLSPIVLDGTDPSSLIFYGTHLDLDYSHSLFELRKSFGSNIGALVVRSTDISFGVSVASWDAAVYDSDGYWDTASRANLQIPNDLVTHVRVGASWQCKPKTLSQQTMLHLNEAALVPRTVWTTNQGNANRDQLWSPIIAVNSGDRFRLSNWTSATNTLEAHAATWFCIVPERFK